jgi:hypothetical protein
MSFSMAAIPESLIEQQRQPLASSRNSSDVVDEDVELGSDPEEETFIVLAEQELMNKYKLLFEKEIKGPSMS